MIAIVTLLVVLLLSLVTVRIATIALILTGASKSLAQFQARSAFTGCGYATNEAEDIVNHPVRRRIVMTLMFLGPAGIVATAGAVVAGTVGSDASRWPLWSRGLFLAGGLAALWFVANSRLVERVMNRLIKRALRKYTTLDVRDYANLLHISGDYGLGEMLVRDSDWVAGKTLAELRLASEGVLVLGVSRAGAGYIGAPASTFTIRPGDQLVLYAQSKRLADLDGRRSGISGALRHADAVAEHKARSQEETTDAEQLAEAKQTIAAIKKNRDRAQPLPPTPEPDDEEP